MTSQAKGRARLQLLLVGAGAVVLVGAAACASTVDDRAQRKDEIAAQELSAPNGRHFRGPVNVVIEAARAQGKLTADQERHLAAISGELKQDRESRKLLHDKLRTSAVAVVRSGTADSAVFDEGVSQAVAAIEQRIQRSSDAVEEIHDLLDADQRAAVAQALRARIDEKFGTKDVRRQRGGVKRFADQLMLSTFQVDKLRAMKKEWFGDKEKLRPTREELLQLVDAFEGDDFRTELDAFRAKKAKVVRAHLAKAGERTDAVLSVLTPDQRELLADLIQDGPEKVLLGEKAGEQARNK
jgi:hypothetical protein